MKKCSLFDRQFFRWPNIQSSREHLSFRAYAARKYLFVLDENGDFIRSERVTPYALKMRRQAQTRTS